MQEIDTQRCLLRKWRQTDLKDLQEIFCSPEIAVLAGFKVRRAEEVEKILKTFIADAEKSLWAIEDVKENKAIGWIELHKFLESDPCIYEIGYTLNQCYWGKGIMPEVITAVIKEIKKTTQIKKIVCAHFDFNIQSKRVIEKCGFHYWKQIEDKVYYEYLIDEKICDVH